MEKSIDILVVVDIQNDFITGSLGTPEAQAIVPKVCDTMKEYNEKGAFIIATKDTHDENYLDTIEGKKLPVKHCIKDTFGWELNSTIDLFDFKRVVLKDTFGSADDDFVRKSGISLPEFIYTLNQQSHTTPDSITLVGLCTDICVISNAIILKSYFPNVPIRVIENCCAGSTPEAHKKAIELMRDSLQIDII